MFTWHLGQQNARCSCPQCIKISTFWVKVTLLFSFWSKLSWDHFERSKRTWNPKHRLKLFETNVLFASCGILVEARSLADNNAWLSGCMFHLSKDTVKAGEGWGSACQRQEPSMCRQDPKNSSERRNKGATNAHRRQTEVVAVLPSFSPWGTASRRFTFCLLFNSRWPYMRVFFCLKLTTDWTCRHMLLTASFLKAEVWGSEDSAEFWPALFGSWMWWTVCCVPQSKFKPQKSLSHVGWWPHPSLCPRIMSIRSVMSTYAALNAHSCRWYTRKLTWS